MLALRTLCGLLGCTLITYILFSYEDEEKKMQSWLEEAWVSLSDYQRTASQRIKDFVQKVLEGILSILNRMYGPKKISFEAFLAAYSFCIAMNVGALTVMGAAEINLHNLIGCILFFFTALFIPFLRRRNVFLSIASLIFIVLELLMPLQWYYETSIRRVHDENLILFNIYLGLPILLPTIAELFAIVILRKSFRKASEATTLFKTLSWFAIGVITSPFMALICTTIYSLVSPGGEVISLPGIFYIYWSIFVSGLTLLISLVAIVGRTIYALLPRVVYSVLKIKMLENRKGTVAIGALLLGVAFPGSGDILEKIGKGIFG
jgi:hypothetical protein